MVSQSRDTSVEIGFAGLGAMGLGMATNLVQAGYTVSGFDVYPPSLETFAARGGQPSPSLADASRGKSKFFVMVASPQQVDQLITELVVSLPQRAILCLFSTLPTAYILDLNRRLGALGRADIRLLESPVSGGQVGANSGNLTIMLSGDDQTLHEIQQELEVISAPGRLFPVGPLGSASTIKMLNQHLAGSHVVIAAETLAFAKALGLNSRAAYDVITESEGGSWIMGDRGTTMLNRDFSPKSAVTIFTKDMGIVNAAADDSLVPCPIASRAYQMFLEREARGHGRDDDASVVCNYEDIIGARVAEDKVTAANLTPSTTPPGQRHSVVLVVDDQKLAQDLRHGLIDNPGDDGKESIQIVCIDGDDLTSVLRKISTETLIGVTGDQRDSLQALSSSFPEHHLFDYYIVHSKDFKSSQIMFSAQHHSNNVGHVLGRCLNERFSLIPVEGAVGSGSAMHSAVRYAALIHAAAAAECYALAVAQGVSVELLYNLISGAAGSSTQFNLLFPKMMAKDTTLGSAEGVVSLRQAMNELRMLKQITQRLKFPGGMLDAAHQMYKSVCQKSRVEETSIAALYRFGGTE